MTSEHTPGPVPGDGAPSVDVTIVGAGLAGLAAAVTLHEAGLTVRVLEREARPGGRVQTDLVDGFRIDRGFQVYLTAYPRAAQLLDLPALDLKRFEAGTQIWHGTGFTVLADPLRRPRALPGTLRSRAATFADKLRVLRLRRSVTAPSLGELFRRPERSTAEALRAAGFSRIIIERFFRPYLGGIFLERELRTSSRFFEFVFRMFSTGDGAVPAAGMGAIPAQLAQRLPAGALITEAEVTAVTPGSPARIRLADGRELTSGAVIVAGPAAMARALVGAEPAGAPADPGRGVTTLSYAAGRSPLGRAVLVLDGTGRGPVNHLAVMSDVAPSYAPTGNALISATVLGEAGGERGDDADLDRRCREQLEQWFGAGVRSWRLLRVDRVRDALPEHAAMTEQPAVPEPAPGVFLAGDYLATPSIEGAIASGLAAAEAAERFLGRAAPSPGLPPGPPSFARRFVVDAPVDAVAGFHEGPDALARLQPPLSGTRFHRVDPLAEGSVTEFTMGPAPVGIRWRAVHRDVQPGVGFTDVQAVGPMRSWIHRHEYRALGPERTEVSDRIWYEHQRGPRGLPTRLLFNGRALGVLFHYRAFSTRRAVSAATQPEHAR